MKDPVEHHVGALDRALRGPAGLKRCMLAEARDGLRDAALAHRDAERAVREFGPVADVAPHYQAELAGAQTRRTALLLVIVFPALLLGWDLLWSVGVAWPVSGPRPPGMAFFIRAQDVLSVVVTVLAVLVLIATLRRRGDPRRLGIVVGVLGAAGGVLCGAVALLMNLLNAPATVQLLIVNPFALPAFAASGVALVAIFSSTAAAVRAAVHH